MIHICYGLYDKDGHYSKFVGTSIISIFENTTSDVTIHILHDNTFSEENRDKFNYMAGRYSQTIKFYNVEKLVPDKIAELRQKLSEVEKTYFSIGTLYRLLIPHIFPQEISKLIYLDADIVVNLNIKELWQIELNDKPLAAVSEFETDTPWHLQRVQNKENYLMAEKIVEHEDYFNAGVLLLNLNQLRDEEKIFSEGIKFIAENHCKWFDQDILNYCFSKKYLKLPTKFDAMVNTQRMLSANNPTPLSKEKIFHYAGGASLSLILGDYYNKIWFEYFSKTPWFNVEIFNHIEKNFQQMYAEQKKFAMQVSQIVSEKERAFFIDKNNIEAAKNIFGVRENELIISADSFQDLIQSMKTNRDKKIFFIVVQNYPAMHFNLVQQGFVSGKDFINGMLFLSDANELSLNLSSVVKNL